MAGRKKTDAELLDEALLAQEQGTYVDPVVEAKRVLARQPVQSSKEDALKQATAEVGAQHRGSPLGKLQTYGKIAKDTAVGAAMPASFLGGPVGMAAGGVLAADSINDAVDNPSLGSAAQAGLSALPFVRPVRNAMNAGKELAAVKKIRSMFGAGDMGAAFSREVPYRAGGGVSGPGDASIVSGPETLMQKARGQVSGFLDRLRGPKAAPETSGSFTSANDLLKNPESIASMDRMAKETAAGQEMAQFGDGAVNEARNVGNRFGGTSVEYHPGGQGPRTLDQLQSTGYGVDAKREVEQYLKRAGLLGVEDATPVEAAVAPRPTGDFVHPEDTTGGAFGFDNVPEISESELTRLQALFKRLGH